MDDSAWGIATASFTLQSNLLQAFVRKGGLTPVDALDVVGTSLRSAANRPDAETTLEEAEIARICLEGVREALATRLTNAAARAMGAFNDAVLTVQRRRSGGKQVVHVIPQQMAILAAARKANQLLGRHGLTWADVISAARPRPPAGGRGAHTSRDEGVGGASRHPRTHPRTQHWHLSSATNWSHPRALWPGDRHPYWSRDGALNCSGRRWL